MKYPYCLYSPRVKIHPLVRKLKGEPYVLDLSFRNPSLLELENRDQMELQNRIDQAMGDRHTWGLAGYLERRDTLLRDCPQMVSEERFYHLGLDVIVPAGTPLHAPLSAVVETAGYEEGEGNYGAYVLLRHEDVSGEPFYSLYGHLSRGDLPAEGARVKAGRPFAVVGDFHENGNWFHHTHLQIITREGFEKGYVSKGYCTRMDLADMPDLCPSPIPFFRI